jgi:F-type H+-transporting ATPase subunit b
VNINLTLIVQMLVFIALIWFTKRFVWPMILTPMEERSRRIAAGLAAAEKGQQDLAQAVERAEAIIREARERGTQIVDLAAKRSNEMIEEAKGTAAAEAERLLAAAHAEVAREVAQAREGLRRQVGQLAIQGAARLLSREIDGRQHAEFLDELAAEIGHG